MPEEHYNIAESDVASVDWQAVIASADEPDCVHYFTKLHSAAEDAKANGNDVSYRVFRLLASVASLHLNAESAEEPFGPMIRTDKGRSAVVEDYSDKDLAVIRSITPSTSDPEFRARLADVLWLRTGDRAAAETAVDAYFESAVRLEDSEMWPRFMPQFERAFRLAAKLGKKGGKFQKAIDAAEGLVRKHSPTDTGLLSARLIELLLEHRSGHTDELSRVSEDLAKRAEAQRNWLFARTYWDINAKLLHRKGDDDSANEAALRSAETFLHDAEAALERKPPDYLVAAHFTSIGLEALRRAGAPQSRLKEVHSRLIAYNEKSTSQMREFASPAIDLSKFVAAAEQHVAGKNFRDALRLLALGRPTIHAKAMRERVERHIREFPLTHLFSAVAIDERGRVTAKRPSLLTSDVDEREAGIRAEMFHQAQIEWQVAAQAFINPARLQILREHHTSPTDLAFLVQTNPFVPSGREAMFARGIHAGLTGDFLVSAHLLVPQVENSLRYVLALNGVVTSKLDSRLIQEERDLSSLLSLPEVTEIFGGDFVFELRGLLVERFGVNLRNRLAHGLVDQQAFQSVHVLYLWWIILRLLFIPIAQSARSSEQIAADEDASAETVMPAWAKDAAVSLPPWTEEDAAEFERRAKAEDPGV